MYQQLKSIVYALVPISLLRRCKYPLRWVVSLAYIGRTYHCRVCDMRLSRFVVLPTGDRLCPRCGSLPRTRRLYALLQQEVAGRDVLHFSPSECLRHAMPTLSPRSYVTSDYEGEFAADLILDITALTLTDDSFDLIICYHVLEHVQRDDLAMEELHRVLRPGGRCYIQTPLHSDLLEDLTVTDPGERLRRYGQRDHVRVYNVATLVSRLASAGLEVDVQHYRGAEPVAYGYKEAEVVMVATKHR